MTTDLAALAEAPLIDKRAVAARLGVSLRTVDRIVAAGELPAVRLGHRTVRYAPADVDALIERQRGGERLYARQRA